MLMRQSFTTKEVTPHCPLAGLSGVHFELDSNDQAFCKAAVIFSILIVGFPVESSPHRPIKNSSVIVRHLR
jgi:hypothetical protein